MKNYFSFNGLAKREEYWAVTILAIFVSWIPYVISLVMAGLVAMANSVLGGFFIFVATVGWLSGLIWAVVATTVRRCRDAGISPFWCLLYFIPVINFWFYIVAGILKSNDQT